VHKDGAYFGSKVRIDDNEEVVAMVKGEIRNAIADMLNSHEQQIAYMPCPTRGNPIVAYDGHIIYKSTLVSELNGNPLFSNDDLPRVKHFMYFNNHNDYILATSSSSSCLLGIGIDYGVHFVQCSIDKVSFTMKLVLKMKKGCKSKAKKLGNGTNILEGVDYRMWWIGCIWSINKAHGKQWTLLHQPLDLMNLTQIASKESMACSWQVLL